MKKNAKKKKETKDKKAKPAGILRRLLARTPGQGPVDFGRQAVDLARRRPRLGARLVLPPLIAALLVALGVAALRIDLLRVQYAVAAATLEEQRLLDESRSLTAHMLKLRDPVELAVRARELGFVRPARLIDMSGTVPAEPTDPPSSARIASHQPAHVQSLP